MGRTFSLPHVGVAVVFFKKMVGIAALRNNFKVVLTGIIHHLIYQLLAQLLALKRIGYLRVVNHKGIVTCLGIRNLTSFLACFLRSEKSVFGVFGMMEIHLKKVV